MSSKVPETETQIIGRQCLCVFLEVEELSIRGESWPKFPLQAGAFGPGRRALIGHIFSQAQLRSWIGYIVDAGVSKLKETYPLDTVTGRSLLPGRRTWHHTGLKNQLGAHGGSRPPAAERPVPRWPGEAMHH